MNVNLHQTRCSPLLNQSGNAVLTVIFNVLIAFAIAMAVFFWSIGRHDSVQIKVLNELFDPYDATPSNLDFEFRGIDGGVYVNLGCSSKNCHQEAKTEFSLHLRCDIEPQYGFKIEWKKQGLHLFHSMDEMPENDMEALSKLYFFGGKDMRQLLVRPGVFDALRQLSKFEVPFAVRMSTRGVFEVIVEDDIGTDEESLKKTIAAGLIIFRQATQLMGELNAQWTIKKKKKYAALSPADADFFPENLDLEALGFHPDSVPDLPFAPRTSKQNNNQ